MKVLFALLTATAVAAAFPAAAAVIRVQAKNIAFSPRKISAHVGDTVEWSNADFVSHTATAKNGAWDVMLPPHKTGHAVLKKAGTIAYYCRFHPNMTGEIVVKPK